MKALALLSLVTVTAAGAAIREARSTTPALIAQTSVEARVEPAEPVVEPASRRVMFGGVPSVAAVSAPSQLDPAAEEEHDSGDCILDEDDRCPDYPGYVSDDENGCPDIPADADSIY
jgi:hypothetical protein